MGKFAATVLGVIVFSAGFWTATTPASALGGCGVNFHRNPYGHCVFGGQREAWCLRHRGHVAGYGAYGRRWCR